MTITPLSRFVGLTLALVTISCASVSRTQGGLKPAHMERLYFGRNIGDTAVVSDSAWNGFVREVLSMEFPDGSTTWSAWGRWRAPDGTPVSEPTYVVELLHVVTPDVELRVQRVIDAYKQRFAQYSVLRVVTDVRATF